MPAKKEKLSKILRRFGACEDAKEWADDQQLAKAWNSCTRGDWLLWIAFQIIGNTRDTAAGKALWLARADCAATALKFYEQKHPGDTRVRECIQGIRDYARGKIDAVRLDELRRAAAYAAAAADAAANAARSKALAKCADIVRKHIPFRVVYAAYKVGCLEKT